MRPTVRKLEVRDLGTLERLVAENVASIEPGLQIIDSRLLLGQAVIDLVGLDARGALVLLALDFTAEEALLLRVMDAYAWCIEYPETLQRLYPMATLSAGRPPRIVFVVERLTDAFRRRVRQLSFLEIDCLEFRHLEVNGAPAAYFDLVERLRRAAPAAPVEAGAPRAIEPPVARPPSRQAWVPPRPAVTEPLAPPPVARRFEAAADVVEAVAPATPVAAAAEPETPEVESAPEPARVVDWAEPAAVELAAEPEGAEVPVPEAPASAEAPAPVQFDWQALVAQAEAAEAAGPRASAPAAAPAPAAPAAEPAPAAKPTTPIWAKPSETAVPPAGSRAYFFAQAAKSPTPAEPTPAAPAAQPAPAANGSAAPAAEHEPLSLPKDGLSRQWLEFLNQLGATK